MAAVGMRASQLTAERENGVTKRKTRGQRMARMIFEACMTDGSGTPEQTVQRLAFKGGTWPDNETDLGGMNEDCLASEIDAALKRTATSRGDSDAGK
jgi:hypothetical protein